MRAYVLDGAQRLAFLKAVAEGCQHFLFPELEGQS